MRLGILDVGSQGAHLDVLRLRPGRPVQPLAVVKRPTGLAPALDTDGTIAPDGVERLITAIGSSVRAARRAGVREILAYGTSSIRDAPNREDVIERVADACGIRLGFLSGEFDARLTYRGALEWAGPSTASLFVADLGGGTLELAAGDAEGAGWAVSLPLGAGLLTRTRLPGDPPKWRHVESLRERLAKELAAVADAPRPHVPADALMLATSKTFAQLAALTGGFDSDGRPAVTRRAVRKHIPRLAEMCCADRARLDGVSAGRAPQILAGAVVAEALMMAFGISMLTVCPWALREGIALTYRLTLDADHGDRAARKELGRGPVVHLLDALTGLRAALGARV
ncbi:Ppx/GppA phosphatase family protein [Actinospica robiniae]|uniref:Ppx/GppA phosphatase family protein n=1 Tax=Actinospica robiniae TaxID=304901 RepID=UPI00146FABAB|nr:hypothetical protein [Actinospica robiniae]